METRTNIAKPDEKNLVAQIVQIQGKICGIEIKQLLSKEDLGELLKLKRVLQKLQARSIIALGNMRKRIADINSQ